MCVVLHGRLEVVMTEDALVLLRRHAAQREPRRTRRPQRVEVDDAPLVVAERNLRSLKVRAEHRRRALVVDRGPERRRRLASGEPRLEERHDLGRQHLIDRLA